MRAAAGRIAPDRWPSEMPLFIAVVLVAALIWLVLIISVIGLLYALLLGLVFFLSHVAFVAYLRGSGVRLGPEQFPALHGRIQELARAMDMEPPAAYLMQAGGVLNAFATRFLGRNIMVLYSDLLEACGDNEGARDMIIAHELAHLRCGHLRWMWLTLPARVVPFLGGALSRAREYTCDRYGLAGAGNARDAAIGMAILSAGPAFGPQVNLNAFARQRADTNTGLMTIGEWLSSHPPLSKRIVAIDPSVTADRFHPWRGRVIAIGILAVTVTVGVAATMWIARVGPGFLRAFEQASGRSRTATASQNADLATRQAQADLATLSSFIAMAWPDGTLPADISELEHRWTSSVKTPFPIDPFDGYEYGYEVVNGGYRLWSSGPDGVSDSRDDIVVERVAQRQPPSR